jgi:uncharacterized protein (UPF0332 family)
VKPITSSLFKQANKLLVEADVMIEVGLFEAAGRNAYLAGCFAARALIFEDSEKVTNQHRRLWGDLTGALQKRGLNDPSLTSFLPNIYALKRIADYETGSSQVTRERVVKAAAEAGDYVRRLETIAASTRP